MRKLLKQALDALQVDDYGRSDKVYYAKLALRNELEKPEPEPVAWDHDDFDICIKQKKRPITPLEGWRPLYPYADMMKKEEENWFPDFHESQGRG